MKYTNAHIKITIFAFLVMSTQLVFSQRYSIGAASVYGSKIEALGYQLRAYYNIKHATCFGPEVAIFPKTTHHSATSEQVDISLTEYNFNGHHHFSFGLKNVGLYPLAGVNLSREKEDEHLHKAYGFNIGVGFHYSKKKWTIFSEFIHLTGDLSQETMLLGFFYTPQKKHAAHE
jgi:hypothetical protein